MYKETENRIFAFCEMLRRSRQRPAGEKPPSAARQLPWQVGELKTNGHQDQKQNRGCEQNRSRKETVDVKRSKAKSMRHWCHGLLRQRDPGQPALRSQRSVAHAQRQAPINKLKFEVTGSIDPRGGNPGFEHIPVYPHDIGYVVHIDSPASKDAIDRLFAEVERTCPILNLLRNPQHIKASVEQTSSSHAGDIRSDKDDSEARSGTI